MYKLEGGKLTIESEESISDIHIFINNQDIKSVIISNSVKRWVTLPFVIVEVWKR